MALKKVGALWRKTKDGKTHFTGVVDLITTKLNIIVMPYIPKDGKGSTKSPAYTILVSDGKTSEQSPTTPVVD